MKISRFMLCVVAFVLWGSSTLAHADNAPLPPVNDPATPAPAAAGAITPAPATPSSPSAPAPLVEKAPPRNQVALEPLLLLDTGLGLRFERALSPYLSLALAPSVFGNLPHGTGFIIMGQLRVYFEAHAMNGWYISPQAGYARIAVLNTDGTVTQNQGPAFRVMAGYNWIIDQVLSIYVGGGLISARLNGDANSDTESLLFPAHGILPAIELGLGYPF